MSLRDAYLRIYDKLDAMIDGIRVMQEVFKFWNEGGR
jgi:hypothetical protein